MRPQLYMTDAWLRVWMLHGCLAGRSARTQSGPSPPPSPAQAADEQALPHQACNVERQAVCPLVCEVPSMSPDKPDPARDPSTAGPRSYACRQMKTGSGARGTRKGPAGAATREAALEGEERSAHSQGWRPRTSPRGAAQRLSCSVCRIHS